MHIHYMKELNLLDSGSTGMIFVMKSMLKESDQKTLHSQTNERKHIDSNVPRLYVRNLNA